MKFNLLNSVLPPKDTIVTITRTLTKRERMKAAKEQLSEMIRKQFPRGERVWFTHNRLTTQYELVANCINVRTYGRGFFTSRNEYNNADEFHRALMNFPVDVLLRIIKLLEKNRLTAHAKHVQQLKLKMMQPKSEWSVDCLK